MTENSYVGRRPWAVRRVGLRPRVSGGEGCRPVAHIARPQPFGVLRPTAHGPRPTVLGLLGGAC
jgi:hypothetical protein